MAVLVTIPRVPSDPMNSCFMSNPVLSFLNVHMPSTTSPLAKT